MQKKENKYQFIKISELSPYENNARTHSNEQIEAICNSIKEFGFINPVIIDENNMILVGHGRIEAAKVLGIDEAPFRRIENLTEDQKRAYILADNKLSDLGGWNEDLLAQELGEIELDMSLFGFDNIDIGDLDINEDIEEDEVPEIDDKMPPKAKRGEIYKLGNHFLMCGDATSETDVKRLLSYNRGGLRLIYFLQILRIMSHTKEKQTRL
jgi:ParB-like chromosome segregation protein Spo0J